MSDIPKTHPLGDVSPITQKYTSDALTITITEIGRFAVLFAKQDKQADLMKVLGIEMTPSQACQTKSFSALPLSPGQWALVFDDLQTPQDVTHLENKITGLGYLSEQSDSRVRFVISGVKARDLMSRGCRLDLHPAVISKGFCAQTVMAQIGVLIHVTDAQPIFELYVYSGFARSFWYWLDQTAAQFNVS